MLTLFVFKDGLTRYVLGYQALDLYIIVVVLQALATLAAWTGGRPLSVLLSLRI